MVEQNNLTKYEYGKLSLCSSIESANKNHEIMVPFQLLDTIAKSIQQQPNIRDNLKKSEEVGKSLYELIIRPDLQHGIDNGQLIWNECAVEIRDVSTGKYAGKIQLQKYELPDNNVIEQSTPSALSNITKSICSISGQIQLAEISMKIDILNDKVDQIIETLWREKISELKAKNKVIEKALLLLPDEKALDRLNNLIDPLESLSNFFLSTMESILSKKISLSLWQSFIEGFKITELKKKDREEYNKEYIRKIGNFLGEYGFILECYSQAMGMLGTCYQIVHDYNTAKSYYDEIHNNIEHYSYEAYKKLEYLLNITDGDGEGIKDLHDIKVLIKNRNIPLSDAISDSVKRFDRANDMYEHLKNQFNNSEIKIIVGAQLLLGDEINYDKSKLSEL